MGWYSYKIVVKQNQQEYYNVYTAGALKGNPVNTTESLSNSYIVLLNDNINKVPRDLSEVGPTDRTFRSSVQLFGRVENILSPVVGGTPVYSNSGNKQYYPGQRTFTVNQIEDLFDTFEVQESLTSSAECFLYSFEASVAGEEVAYVACGDAPNTTIWTSGNAPLDKTVVCAVLDSPVINFGTPSITQQVTTCQVEYPITSNTNPYFAFFRAESDPFIASVTTSQIPTQQFGVANQTSAPYFTVDNLAILETEPFVSNIDIFWETSTSGLISDLNTLILDSNDGAQGFSDFNTNFKESVGGNGSDKNILSSDFTLVNNAGFDLAYNDYDAGTFKLEITGITGPLNTVISTDATVGGPFFELYNPTPGNTVNESNNYNIRITNAFLQSTSLINYYSEESTGIFIFNFKFSGTLSANGEVQELIQTKQIVLQNVAPVIYHSSGGVVTPEPSPPTEVNITLDYSSINIFRTITAKNGAYSGPVTPFNNQTGNEIVWKLKVETVPSGSAVAEEITNLGYFNLVYPTGTPTTLESTAQLQWNGGPVAGYKLTVTAVDGNDQDGDNDLEDEVIYNISSGTTTTAIQYCYHYNDNQDSETCVVTYINVQSNSSMPESVGYYRFYGGFNELPVNEDGNPVLNYTTAFKNEFPQNNQYNCGQGGTGGGPVLIPGADPSLPASYTIEPYNGLMFGGSGTAGSSMANDFLNGNNQNSFCSTFCVDGSIINGTNGDIFCNNFYEDQTGNDWPITVPESVVANMIII